MRLADYVISRFVEIGLERCYLVTGRGSLFLNDALARSADIKAVPMHHEQSAAYAACAEAALNYKPALCMVSTGCAATNAISGVLTAWQDGLPVIFISGQHVSSESSRITGIKLRTYGQQETDIVEIVTPITKYAVTISEPARIRYELDKAIHEAQSGRHGPVWIDIPLDLQSATVDPESLEPYVNDAPLQFEVYNSVSRLAQLLDSAQRPIFLTGSGAKHSDTPERILSLATRLNIPIVCTPSSVDQIDARDPMLIGPVGAMACSRAANLAVQNSDLLLVFGSRLNSMITGQDFNTFARDAQIVVVDIDELEHSKAGPTIDLFLNLSCEEVIADMERRRLQTHAPGWLQTCQAWKDAIPNLTFNPDPQELVDLYRLAEVLGSELPSDAVVVTDSGLIELIIPTNVPFTRGQRCIHPVSQGAMGYALPAAIGIAMSTNRPVVAVIGDGSIMMNLQELQTIQHFGLPIKILIVNNDAYAVIRKRQKELFRNRTIGTDSTNGLSCPNFSAVASAFGLDYMRVDNQGELEANLSQLFSLQKSTLCEVFGLPEQDYVRTSGFINAQRQYKMRPLEDQLPFLDRQFLRDQMIVEPLNLD